MLNKLRKVAAAVTTAMWHPSLACRAINSVATRERAIAFADQSLNVPTKTEEPSNKLRDYFDSVREGPGIWKWLHYFDIYHRHFQRFIGQPVTVVEVGVYSGGSMAMWRQYFGEACHVHGVDIEPACKAYENAFTTIHIGDQADRDFWCQFRKSVPNVDLLIDDGGHEPEQQIVTLEEMLPHIRPGGVYLCEDVHGISNSFTSFAHSLADRLNFSGQPTLFQSAVHSVHLYPFVVVIEKREHALAELRAPKHGTQWQPFL